MREKEKLQGGRNNEKEKEEDDEEERGLSLALIASAHKLGQVPNGRVLEEDLKREIVTQIWRQDRR